MEQNGAHKKNLTSFGLILGLSLILSAMISGFVFYKTRLSVDTLEITGSAKKVIISDVVKWKSNLSRNVAVNELSAGYAQISNDLEKVKSFLKNRGIDEKNITISPVYLDPQYDYSKGGELIGYILRQEIAIQSNEVQKITDLAKDTRELIDQGVIFSTQPLEYYYTNLPETRIELLADAVKDAERRAEKIADSTGKKIGSLKSASVGVVQVLPVNSIEISDYGAYDTSSIEKEIMITVRTTFRLQ
jgi:hypothetical protein